MLSLAGLGLGTSTATAATPPAHPASSVAARTGGNPLEGGTWGVYRGSADGVYPAWEAAAGHDKDQLAKVALRPRVRWFGGWTAASIVGKRIRDYIDETQAGDPNVLVQLAIFRLFPDGETHKDDPLTKADRRAYRHWVDVAAAAIGSSRVAMILEPDLGVALKGWRPAVRLNLTRYAAGVFGKLPNTSVYIDASDADWLKPSVALTMLRKAGVQYVRGFALGATHYASVAKNIAYGTKLVAALGRHGVPGRHFVVDTADNGRPFTWKHYYKVHPRGRFDNAQVCRTPSQTRCITLGIPPTTAVADARWHLPASVVPKARKHVDGYLWFGRPWLVRQASPFSLPRTLAITATTPY